MTINNVRIGLQRKLAGYRGALEFKHKELKHIEESIARLPDYRREIADLEALIQATETLLRFEYPEQNLDDLKPIHPAPQRVNPYPRGMLGRTALEILREDQSLTGMTVREVSVVALQRAGFADPTPEMLEAVVCAVGVFFKSHLGRTLETDDQMPRRWWVSGRLS